MSVALVWQLPYYLFLETCFMDSNPKGGLLDLMQIEDIFLFLRVLGLGDYAFFFQGKQTLKFIVLVDRLGAGSLEARWAAALWLTELAGAEEATSEELALM